MPTAYHMVHYRRFECKAEEVRGRHLEQMCRSALDVTDKSNVALWKRANDRIFATTDVDGRQIFLNKVADLSSAVFGEMCLVQSKDLQALLQLETSRVQLSNLTEAEIYKLDERAAPSGSQFIRGMAYWMSIGNHVLFVKMNGMSSDLIYKYVDWLLKARTDVLPTSSLITLQAEFDPAEVPNSVGDIKSLRVTGRSKPPMKISPLEESSEGRTVKTARKVAEKFAQFEQAVPIVEALLGPAKATSLVESLGPQEYLSVEAAVQIRGRRTEASRRRMREIVTDVADTTEGEVRVEGKDGTISGGDAILRTRMPFNLPHEGSNLLEFDNVADQLQEVYARFVKDEKIKP